VIWLDIRCIRVEKKHPTSVFFKTDFDQERFDEVRQQYKTGDRSGFLMNLKPAYSASLPITKAKKQDLMSLCTSKAIPDLIHNFYKDLIRHVNMPGRKCDTFPDFSTTDEPSSHET